MAAFRQRNSEFGFVAVWGDAAQRTRLAAVEPQQLADCRERDSGLGEYHDMSGHQ